jgi:phosphohistidine swiveling domain-containing protein
MSIKSFPVSISKKPVRGEVIIFNSRKGVNYKNKIVVIKSLESGNLIFKLRKAKAIISEKGSITSHGSIIARELKKSALIIKDAKKIFRNAEVITIKENGLVEKIGVKSGLAHYIGFKHKKAGSWIFIKPRQHSPLRLSLIEEGIKNLPRVLVGSKKKGEYQSTSKGYWYKNIPSPNDLAQKIIYEPRWFQKKLKERKKVFDNLKKYLKILQRKLRKHISIKEAIKELKNIKGYYTKLRPFTYLTQVAIDSFEKKFYHLMTSINLSNNFKRWLNKSLTPEIDKKIIIREAHLLERFHYLYFPPPSLNFKIFNIKIKKIKIPAAIKREFKNFPRQKLALHYLKIFPLMAQLSEQTAYYGRVLKIFTLNILYILAQKLKKNQKLKKVEDIENLTVEEIIEAIKLDKSITKNQSIRLKKIKFKAEPNNFKSL